MNLQNHNEAYVDQVIYLRFFKIVDSAKTSQNEYFFPAFFNLKNNTISNYAIILIII